MLRLFSVNEDLDLYSDDNKSFTKGLQEILKNKRAGMTAYTLKREDNRLIVEHNKKLDVYEEDICDIILNAILEKIKGEKKSSFERNLYFWKKSAVNEKDYLTRLAFEMDTLLLDDLTLIDFDSCSVMKDAIFLDAYAYLRCYYNQDIPVHIPIEGNDLRVDKVENKIVKNYLESLPKDTKKKIINSSKDFKSIVGDYLSVGENRTLVTEKDIAGVEKEGFTEDYQKYVELNFKYSLSKKIQLKLLFDKRIKIFFDKNKTQGKIFGSAKEIYNQLYVANQKNPAIRRDENVNYLFVERLTGFNLALMIYVSVVEFVDKKGDFSKNQFLNDIIAHAVYVKSPILRYWMMSVIGNRIKRARLCRDIKSNEEALKLMADSLEMYKHKFQDLYREAISFFVKVVQWDIENKINDFKGNSMELECLKEDPVNYNRFIQFRIHKRRLEVKQQEEWIKKAQQSAAEEETQEVEREGKAGTKQKKESPFKIHEILDLHDEKMESIACRENPFYMPARNEEEKEIAFYMPESIERFIQTSDELIELEKAKEGSYEYRLFAYIMQTIIKIKF